MEKKMNSGLVSAERLVKQTQGQELAHRKGSPPAISSALDAELIIEEISIDGICGVY